MENKTKKTKNSKQFLFVLFLLLIVQVQVVFAEEGCRGSFINVIKDIRWDAMFPVEIAGIEIKSPSELKNPDKIGQVVCVCKKSNKVVLGITVSYWAPTRFVETTKIPFCFPILGGLKLNNPNQGTKVGGEETDTPATKQSAHWYVMPIWHMMDLFLDVPCLPVEGFDLAYITEVDPTWNNDSVGFILNPEALLVANPVAQMACMADSVASTADYPLDQLFWCMGAWNNPYPMTGTVSESNYIKGNVSLASRMIYKMNRELIHWDTAVDICGAQITPFWIKTHYKMHMVKPTRSEPMYIGRPSILWETGKNMPYGTQSNSPDNFGYMMFQRVKCCLGYSFP